MIKNNKINMLGWISNTFILVLSLAPIAEQIPKPIERSDLIYHGLAYMVTTVLFLWSYSNRIWIITLGLIFQGVTIEFIQPYVNRYFEFLDMLANGIGVGLGTALFYSFKIFLSKSSTGPFKKTSE